MNDFSHSPSGRADAGAGRKGAGAIAVRAAGEDRLPKAGMPVVVKLTLFVGIMLALLLAVLVIANGVFWQRTLRREVREQLSSVATTRRDMVRDQVNLLRQQVQINTDRGELRGFFYELSNGAASKQNREGSQITLRRIANGHPIVAAALADKTGAIVMSTDAAEVGQNISGTPEFQPGLSGVSLGLPHKAHERFEMRLAAPIRTRAEPSQVYGVLLATADVTDLANTLRNGTGLGKTGDTLLAVRDNDQMRFLFPPRDTPDTTVTPLDASPALKLATSGVETLQTVKDYRGVPVLAVSRYVGVEGWGLVAKIDASEAYRPTTVALLLEVLAGLIVMAMGLIAAYLLARSFTRPLRELVRAAARVTAGNYDTEVDAASGDEFGHLAANFNEMTAALRARSQERHEAEDALRQADRRKDEFLAMLGHELRNPLSAIANAVRLWRAAAADRGATELAREIIERQTTHLSRLVDDLLDVSRITEGKIELRKEPVNVVDAINRAIETARPFIDDRRHELEISLATRADLYVEADPTRLEQIITNLLTNAIKYTRRAGRITIQAVQDEASAVISVTDNGIGMSARTLPHIFELFAQGDRSLDRTTGGLGIGLNLCRKLVELHGGTIIGASEGVGKGSTFTVRMPIIAAPTPVVLPPPPPVAPAEHGGPSRRILLVDDNQDTVRSLSHLLILRGHQVATAFDGIAALEVAQEFRPNFLLLDLGLPGLDGYELARRLRAGGFPRTPIVAISGYAQASDRARSRAAGFDYHFAKPVDFEALAELIVEEPIAAE